MVIIARHKGSHVMFVRGRVSIVLSTQILTLRRKRLALHGHSVLFYGLQIGCRPNSDAHDYGPCNETFVISVGLPLIMSMLS